MRNKEVEFKYKANNLSLSAFKKFCESCNPDKFILVSGYDFFYSKSDDPTSFYRHRVNTNENQLTFKRKTDPNNNFIREEHNIDLPLGVSAEKIKDLCNITGYKYNCLLFKNCFIYNFSYYTLVYYVVYNEDLNELGRFFEIEMKEDGDWSDEHEAYRSLVSLEKMVGRELGITPENRVSKSLFELFRKE